MASIPTETTVIVVDDHPIFRKGLTAIIADCDGYQLVGEADNGEQAIELIEQTTPDIAVMDISMPKLDGLEVLKEFQEKDSDTRFIILTMFDNKEYFEEAVKLGAIGYLLKDDAAMYMVDCLSAVVAGKSYFSPSISELIMADNEKGRHQFHIDIYFITSGKKSPERAFKT